MKEFKCLFPGCGAYGEGALEDHYADRHPKAVVPEMIERKYAEVTFIVQANIAASEPVDHEKLVEFRKRVLLLAEECGLWLASGHIKVGGVQS